MLFLWIIGGIIAVTVAFYVPGGEIDLWPNLYSGGITAILFLAIMIFFTTKKPYPARERTIVWIVFILATALTLGGWKLTSSQVHYQKDTLGKIRWVVGDEVMRTEINAPLTKAYLRYVRQQSPKKRTISDIFQTMHLEDTTTTGLLRTEGPRNGMYLYIATMNDDSVVIVGQEMFVNGTNPAFKNYNGLKGKSQVRGIVTKKGVTYEREN